MPNAATKKTKSAHSGTAALSGQRRRTTALLAIAGMLLIIGLVYGLQPRNSRVDLSNFTLETVRTNEARTKGLGGRAAIAKNAAMVFDFTDGSDGRGFWMQDMRFAIDIAWLNADKKVIKLAQNVQPATYPKTFCSGQNPTYVLEFAAGRASELNIHFDTTLAF